MITLVKINAADVKLGDKLHGECKVPDCVSTVVMVSPIGDGSLNVEWECPHQSTKSFIPSRGGHTLTVIKGGTWQKDPSSSETPLSDYHSGGLTVNETTSFGEPLVAVAEQPSDPDSGNVQQTPEETLLQQTPLPNPFSTCSPSSLSEGTTESS